MNDMYQKWLWKKQGQECVKNLKKHAFDAYFVPNSEAAKTLIIDMIKAYESFGFAGSETTRSIGLLDEVEAMGKTIYDHWQTDLSNWQKNLTKEETFKVRLSQGRCDCFLCSANAVSLTGEIVNVDGVGNRNAAMTFGPKKVVIVAGMNKVRPDLQSALDRVQEIAAPPLAKKLGYETPCAETGFCSDCNSPKRICRITTILHRKPLLTDVSVVLVNEALGF
jgi:L-lactate utilization protein LutB